MPEYKSPGVYVEEVSLFPPLFVVTDPSIPVFTGFTQKAEKAGQSFLHEPLRIHSFREYQDVFGGPHQTTFFISDTAKPEGKEFLLYGQKRYLHIHLTRFFMYESVKMYFANGGGSPYILSLGNYDDWEEGLSVYEPTDTSKNVFSILEKIPDAALIVFPDAAGMRSPDCCRLYVKAIDYCNKVNNAFLICDVLNTHQDLQQDIVDFRNNMVSDHLKHAAAYYPWLQTGDYDASSIGLSDFENPASLSNHLKEAPALDIIIDFEVAGELISTIRLKEMHNKLMAFSPGYNDIINAILQVKNLQPPSGAVCGAYVRTDNNRGVWKAPANVQLANVTGLSFKISDGQQSDMNVPIDGKAINAIRSFTGKGIFIWGARTLDGNSNEWKYISVVRLTKMIETSIRQGMKPFVFEPNDANTWVKIKSSSENFLQQLWREGALQGTKPREAYFVSIGLGQTMTANDILENKLIMQVGVSVVKPAEFIVLSFQLDMQPS